MYRRDDITKKLIPNAVLFAKEKKRNRLPYDAAAIRAWDLRCLQEMNREERVRRVRAQVGAGAG